MIYINNANFNYSGCESQGALKDISLTIKPGECVLLCGKSGCGKTTVTKLINGLIPHFIQGDLKGNISVNGMDVKKTPMYQLSKTVGSVFQNPKSQFFNIDSDSELAFGLENNGDEPAFIKERIEQTVQELQIENLRHRNIFSMSGGEKQTLAFASVYTMNPDIYVLDEPSANLDNKAISILKKQLRYIKAQGKTIVIAEHRLYYLADLIDRAILIVDGKIIKEFSQNEFLCLTDEMREKMGLRTLTWNFPSFKKAQQTDGVLSIKDLSYRYKQQTIFDSVSFSASSGDIIGILGKNGTGKTTLVRCIAGLEKMTSGTICYNGKTMKAKERNNLCYMIMQDVNHQLFGESVWNECERSVDERVAPSDIENVLIGFNLLDYRDKHPMALSGGQKQRLAIVTGILADKEVLIFDEPTSGLDYDHMCVVSRTLKELAQKGRIVLVVTHDFEFLEQTCCRVVKIGDINVGESGL